MIALITGGSKMTKEDIKKQVRRAFDFRMAIRVYNNNDIPKEDMEYILDTAWFRRLAIFGTR